MKTVVFMLILPFCAGSLLAQEQIQSKKTEKSRQEEQAGQPEKSWSVTRELDDQGNVIRYDSTFTWTYKSSEGDSLMTIPDSLLNSFRFFFNEHFPSIWDRNFVQPFMEDSLFMKDFFDEDLFYKKWEEDFFDMDQMFHKMDSLRMEFFRQQMPELMQPLKKPEEMKGKEGKGKKT